MYHILSTWGWLYIYNTYMYINSTEVKECQGSFSQLKPIASAKADFVIATQLKVAIPQMPGSVTTDFVSDTASGITRLKPPMVDKEAIWWAPCVSLADPSILLPSDSDTIRTVVKVNTSCISQCLKLTLSVSAQSFSPILLKSFHEFVGHGR